MPFPRRTRLLALAVGALPVLVGCGGKELPATDAQALLRDLDKVEQGVRAGECEATRPTLRRLDRNVASIPDDVDAQVRTTLDRGVDHLGRLMGKDCRQREPDPVVTEPEPITPPPVQSTPQPSPTITEPPPEQPEEPQIEEPEQPEEPQIEEPEKPEKPEEPEKPEVEKPEKPQIEEPTEEEKDICGEDPAPTC